MYKKYITILNKFVACLTENRPNLIGGGSIFDYDPQVIKNLYFIFPQSHEEHYEFCFVILVSLWNNNNFKVETTPG